MKRVPTHTPSAPSVSAAARPRSVKDPACSGDRDPIADGVDDLRYQRHRRDEPRMASCLGALRDHDVASGLDGRDGVSNLPAHARDEHTVAMAEVDYLTGHAEAGDEQGGPARDDRLDLCLHVAGQRRQQVDTKGLVGSTPDLGDLSLHPIEGHRCGAECAEAACIAHSDDEIGVGDAAHSGEHHRMLAVEKLGQTGLEHDGVLQESES